MIMLIYSIGLIYPQNEQYKFRHLTTKQGLPSNSVNSIMKDSDGFIWFGTDEGLARYDGNNFKTYLIPTDSISGSESQTITKINRDKNTAVPITGNKQFKTKNEFLRNVALQFYIYMG